MRRFALGSYADNRVEAIIELRNRVLCNVPIETLEHLRGVNSTFLSHIISLRIDSKGACEELADEGFGVKCMPSGIRITLHDRVATKSLAAFLNMIHDMSVARNGYEKSCGTWFEEPVTA